VVGISCRLIAAHVAVQTFIPYSAPLKTTLGLVTLQAGKHIMSTKQWKTVLLMKLWNIVDQPVRSSVAAHAVITHGHIVHIYVASHTIVLSFSKNKILMTICTTCHLMLSCQYKPCGIMIEAQAIEVYFPTICTVTRAAVGLETVAMRILSPQDCCE